jgi:hypothetical protein
MKILAKFRKNYLCLAVAGVVALGTATYSASVYADNEVQLTASSIPYLVRSIEVKELKAVLYRFNYSMLLMTNTKNREDFLINRDELWRSREELSFAIKVLEDNANAPFGDDVTAITAAVRELLLKCEDYANNQNELVAKYNNYRDGPNVLRNVFKSLNETELLVSKRDFTPEEEVKYVQITSARGAYETAIEDMFMCSSSTEMTEIVERIQRTHEAYMNVVNENGTLFPEIKSSFEEADISFKKMFANKGYGSEFYSFLQQKEVQENIESYYQKAIKDILKDVSKLEAKIKARLS